MAGQWACVLGDVGMLASILSVGAADGRLFPAASVGLMDGLLTNALLAKEKVGARAVCKERCFDSEVQKITELVMGELTPAQLNSTGKRPTLKQPSCSGEDD